MEKNSLKTLRELYKRAHLESEICNDLIKRTQSCDEAVTIGYNAAAKMVSSKFLINPFKIIKVFNDGKEQLETLIQQNLKNIELRYLRYTIQVNTPAFVGYNKNKKEDRELIFRFLQSCNDNDLKNHILFYLKDTNDLLPEELNYF